MANTPLPAEVLCEQLALIKQLRAKADEDGVRTPEEQALLDLELDIAYALAEQSLAQQRRAAQELRGGKVNARLLGHIRQVDALVADLAVRVEHTKMPTVLHTVSILEADKAA